MIGHRRRLAGKTLGNTFGFVSNRTCKRQWDVKKKQWKQTAVFKCSETGKNLASDVCSNARVRNAGGVPPPTHTHRTHQTPHLGTAALLNYTRRAAFAQSSCPSLWATSKELRHSCA